MEAVLKIAQGYGPFAVLFVLLVGGVSRISYKYYMAVISDGGSQRNDLIRKLKVGGTARITYNLLLGRALNYIDKVISDAHLLRRGQEAPDWTGRLIDVCAILAVSYPILSLVLTWVLVGDTGVLGAAFGFPPGAPLYARALVAIVLTFLGGIVILARRGNRLLALFFGGVGIVLAGYAAFATGYPSSIPMATAASYGIAAAAVFRAAGRSGSWTAHGAGALTFIVLTAGLVRMIPLIPIVDGYVLIERIGIATAVLLLLACSTAVVLRMARAADRRGRLGLFWLCFGFVILIFSVIALGAEASGGKSTSQDMAGYVFLTIVPIINIPFDWLSIGLTRRLLRWGLRPNGPHPFFIALIDIILASALVYLLSLTLVAAIAAADFIVAPGGGRMIVPVVPALSAILKRPQNPANIWIYLVVFSTLIPGIINCVIGIASLMTWKTLAKFTRRFVVAYARAPEERSGLKQTLPILLSAGWAAGSAFVLGASWISLWVIFHATPLGTWMLRGLTQFGAVISSALETYRPL